MGLLRLCCTQGIGSLTQCMSGTFNMGGLGGQIEAWGHCCSLGRRLQVLRHVGELPWLMTIALPKDKWLLFRFRYHIQAKVCKWWAPGLGKEASESEASTETEVRRNLVKVSLCVTSTDARFADIPAGNKYQGRTWVSVSWQLSRVRTWDSWVLRMHRPQNSTY